VAREYSLAELADGIAEIKAIVSTLPDKMLSREVFHAEFNGLRTEMHSEISSVRRDIQDVDKRANQARLLALWSFGVLASALIGTVILIIVEIVKR
jgi:hypothetical protein